MRLVRAFTLIELMVVISIISLLASIVLASLNDARAKARDTRRISDMRNIRTAIELYRSDNDGAYPPMAENEDGSSGWDYSSYDDDFMSNLMPKYLSQKLLDPINSTGDYSYYYAAEIVEPPPTASGSGRLGLCSPRAKALLHFRLEKYGGGNLGDAVPCDGGPPAKPTFGLCYCYY